MISIVLCFLLKLSYRYQTNVIFGTLKDGSLPINSLALNNCFSCRNVFQNGVKPFVYQKAQNFV